MVLWSGLVGDPGGQANGNRKRKREGKRSHVDRKGKEKKTRALAVEENEATALLKITHFLESALALTQLQGKLL